MALCPELQQQFTRPLPGARPVCVLPEAETVAPCSFRILHAMVREMVS